jgi:hypothetical protein
MLAAGASEADSEITLAFVDIVRQKVDEQV